MTDAVVVDPDPIALEFPCLRAVQPIGDLYVASIPHRDLTKITYFDVRRVIQEERDVERYLGIQRPLNRQRVSQLNEYVNFYDASFPTAIIISIPEQYAIYDERTSKLKISNVPKDETQPDVAISDIAKVLDGQHRIAGLSAFTGESFELPVTIFLGADIADQAHIFATVNLEQNKVNRSLAYDLYSLANSRSPQKTGHSIAVVLDMDDQSPLYRRIKRLGIRTEGRSFEPLTQATVVDAILNYVSKYPKRDRDILLRGKRIEKAIGEEVWELPFRNMFIEDNDVAIVEVLVNYFAAIRDRWPVAWDDRKRGNMLNRTNGFRAFMRAFDHIHRLYGSGDGRVLSPSFVEFLNKVKLHDKDFNTERFLPGTTGESELLRTLRAVE